MAGMGQFWEHILDMPAGSHVGEHDGVQCFEVEDLGALKARQKLINDAYDKIIDLPATEYQRLNFRKLD